MWGKRIKAALGMGLVWAVGGAVIGGVMEFLANLFPALNVVDMWIQPIAITGFFAGVIFSGVLALAARNRRFDELSASRMAGWGALGGLAAGVLVIAIGAGPIFWILLASTLVSSAAATGTLAVARVAERRSLASGSDAAQRIE